MLLDRRAEREALDRLLDDVRAGLSGALVLRGEAGIGKTALLEYAIESAADLRVARVLGVESEMELGFAALHQLMVPFLPRLDGLPAPQRAALGSAFGLTAGPPPDRFLVGLAVLTLLAAVAEDQPLLCVVDDAEWLDQASAEVLAFVARRLHAERVAFVFGVWEPADGRARLEGLPVLHLRGLSNEDALELLAAVVAGPLDGAVGERILAETGGNPLALVELSGELTPSQLAGRALLPEPLPLGQRLQDRFERRYRALPSDTQTVLLLAAADPSGDPTLYWRATAVLGLSVEAAAPAVADRLLALGPRITFRHPLIRSAVYHGASGVDRQRIHGALAAASEPDMDADRRAWHRAAAALGPDEDVAEELERSADRAKNRGGQAAAAACLARAAELTPDPNRQADRLLGAAQAELMAGSPAIAQGLLERATPQLSDHLRAALAERLQGAIRAIDMMGTDKLAPDEGPRWLGLGYVAAGELFDSAAVHALASRWVRLSRDQGVLTTLPLALGVLGGSEVLAGRFAVAEACFAEGRDISMATGNPGVLGPNPPQQLLLLAWQGRESETRSAAASVTRDSIQRSQGKVVTYAQLAIGVLELGLGHYQAALGAALTVYEDDPVYLGTLGLPDLVEAGARADNRPAAESALDRLAQRATTNRTDLASGLLARSRALLADDTDAEGFYQEAIEHLQRSAMVPDLARAHLLYGEWLRRQRRRRHARDELGTAYQTFESMGAEGFAERARIELLATGERARKRSVDTHDDLTPQEAQIAWLATEGASNPEIAAQLFLSSSTVEYHLRKVFRKLGLTSRNQLAGALPERAQSVRS